MAKHFERAQPLANSIEEEHPEISNGNGGEATKVIDENEIPVIDENSDDPPEFF